MMSNEIIKQHENSFINAFLVAEQQQRFCALLKSKKGRKKIRDSLSHSIKFKPQTIRQIPTDKQAADDILKLLIKNQSPTTCYLISEHTSFDEKEMDLNKALRVIVGSGIATIISCIPGKLAYYEGEGFSNRFILKSV